MTHPVSRRIAAVERDLSARGFEIERQNRVTIAVDGPSNLTGLDAPLQLVHLTDGTPLTVASAIANATDEGRVPLLVADEWTLEEAQEVVTAPFLLADRRDSTRQFYPVEDRIRLSDETFACIGTSGRIEWSEAATGCDDPELLFAVGDETIAAFDSAGELCCPEPTAFRYRYSRGEDGQLRVFRRNKTVGRYASFRSMRTDGFRPAPLPLVPEHHVRRNGHLARAVLLASVDGDTLEAYR